MDCNRSLLGSPPGKSPPPLPSPPLPPFLSPLSHTTLVTTQQTAAVRGGEIAPVTAVNNTTHRVAAAVVPLFRQQIVPQQPYTQKSRYPVYSCIRSGGAACTWMWPELRGSTASVYAYITQEGVSENHARSPDHDHTRYIAWQRNGCVLSPLSGLVWLSYVSRWYPGRRRDAPRGVRASRRLVQVQGQVRLSWTEPQCGENAKSDKMKHRRARVRARRAEEEDTAVTCE